MNEQKIIEIANLVKIRNSFECDISSLMGKLSSGKLQDPVMIIAKMYGNTIAQTTFVSLDSFIAFMEAEKEKVSNKILELQKEHENEIVLSVMSSTGRNPSPPITVESFVTELKKVSSYRGRVASIFLERLSEKSKDTCILVTSANNGTHIQLVDFRNGEHLFNIWPTTLRYGRVEGTGKTTIASSIEEFVKIIFDFMENYGKS